MAAKFFTAGIDAVKIYMKVESCTSDKDDAPPVWMFDELAELAKEGPDTAQQLADQVNKRLQAKSPVTKWKVGLGEVIMRLLS